MHTYAHTMSGITIIACHALCPLCIYMCMYVYSSYSMMFSAILCIYVHYNNVHGLCRDKTIIIYNIYNVAVMQVKGMAVLKLAISVIDYVYNYIIYTYI